ncbi:uncharacterized protein C6orf132 homolog [Myripristis murdjan]|uniref:uncharacterized protein C6orf132 homolog n=1 Tax=Myripristis murdjan TaxID=586833 RepID=UPI001176072E|nr:uncharacterized protein C6orf132 homolog [Myripristis murdjan]
MKKGAFSFLGRKSQSLFDTNIQIKDMDNVELVLDSSAIPESGTAKVRARPTVKHHTSSADSLQGFAVPTPKVPVLPPFNGPKINGSSEVKGDWMSNGSVISVPDLVEGEILVPPPPSMAPPPPPTHNILPPPDFMGDLDTLDLATLHPPSMSPPKPPSLTPSLEDEEDLTCLKPPPMAPPKPPSTCSSASASSFSTSTPPPSIIPDCPSFSPPQPPTERQNKTQKTPPPKPVRLSSIPSLDNIHQDPAPAPPVQTPTPSTFNPQNAAKLYNIPKTSILSTPVDREARPKQILLLEDSVSVNSFPVPIQSNGQASPVAPPSKPVQRNSSGDQLDKNIQELKENTQTTLPSQSPLSQPKREAKTDTLVTQQEVKKPLQTPGEISPKPKKEHIAQVKAEDSRIKVEASPSHSGKFSPILDRKLRNLKSSEINGTREGHAVSPLALLMIAKEREKQRSALSNLSHENNTKKTEQSNSSIQPSDSNPNSFIVIPRSTSSSSLSSLGTIQESSNPVTNVEQTPPIQTPGRPKSPAFGKGEKASTNPTLNGISTAASTTPINLAVQNQDVQPDPSQSKSAQDKDIGEELSMPLLPPPPEFASFDDLDEITEPPPSIRPPDPPMKKAPSLPSVIPPPPSQCPPPPTKPKPPAPPKLPPPDMDIKPMPPSQTKSMAPPTQPPASLSVRQATLLSILQKKMLEMDHKIVPMKETESSTDDWSSPLSDEETKIPDVPRASPQNKNHFVSSKTAGLDMRELETKVTKKQQDKTSSKDATSNGPQSKQQYGMTFTVRPGTKQPITLVNKGDSS